MGDLRQAQRPSAGDDATAGDVVRGELDGSGRAHGRVPAPHVRLMSAEADRPAGSTFLVFGGVARLGGVNAIAVKESVQELDPFWSAGRALRRGGPSARRPRPRFASVLPARARLRRRDLRARFAAASLAARQVVSRGKPICGPARPRLHARRRRARSRSCRGESHSSR